MPSRRRESLLSLPAACGPDKADQNGAADELLSPAAVAELKLDDGEMLSIADIDNAELERRLRGHVGVRDGLLILHGPFLDGSDTYVLPLPRGSYHAVSA